MAKIPMGNFGNALPQTQRIQMPQSNIGQLGAAIGNLGNTANNIAQQKDQQQREQEESAKRLELYNNQIAEAEAKVKLDDVLTTEMSEKVTLLKNDVANGAMKAQDANTTLQQWSQERYKQLETELPGHAQKDLKQYWDTNITKQAPGFLPLQLRADTQKSVALVDRVSEIATRYERKAGREYIETNLANASISEAEKQERLYKYESVRDGMDIDGRITKAVSNKDTADLQALITDLDGGKYGYTDGPTAQQKKAQALSRIDAITKQNEVEENKRKNEAGKVFNEFKSQVLTGRALEDGYLADVGTAVKGTEHEADYQFYKDQSNNFQSFGRKSTSQMLELINQQKAKMKNSKTSDAVAEEKVLGVYEEIYREKLNTSKNNPNQIVREAGLQTHELTPMELKADPASFIKKVVDNGSSQLAMNDANLKLAPISVEDLPEVKKAFNEKSVDQKLSFIGGLIQQTNGMKKGRQVWGAILNQLGDGNQNYVAAGLAKQQGFKSTLGRELSTSIVNGTQLLKNKQLVMPKENDLRLEFNKYLGNTASGTDANAMYQTFKAVYADTMHERSMQHNSTDDSPDKDVLNFALAFTTGGIYTQPGTHRNYNGDKIKDWRVTKPYGWKDDQFESSVEAGYRKISHDTGIPVADLEGLRLQRSPTKSKKGELQYELLDERGNPLKVKGVHWTIVMPGATK
jgi:hypothetical protein